MSRLRRWMTSPPSPSSSWPAQAGHPAFQRPQLRGHDRRDVLDRPPSRTMTGWTRRPSRASCHSAFVQHDTALPSRGAMRPSDAAVVSLQIIERAQGRPGAGRTHGPRAAKKHAAEPQVRAEHPAFPARMGYGLYALSSGTGVLAPVVRDARQTASLTWHQHRDARTTRLRRPCSRRSSAVARTSIAARTQRIVTTRTSLCMRRDVGRQSRFPKIRKQNIFAGGRAGAFALKALANFVGPRDRFYGLIARRRYAERANPVP